MPLGAVRRKTASRREPDAPVQFQTIPSYEGGYNSYAKSRTLIKDTEVSSGTNAVADGNGAMGKRNGKVAVSPVLSDGYPVAATDYFTVSSVTKKIALAGTTLWSYTETSKSALTGYSFTPADPVDCRLVQAAGRLYVCAPPNNLYYTEDGTSLALQANAFPLKYGVYYGNRLYGIRPDYPDRIYYSNPLNADITSTTDPYTPSAADFGSFQTDLSSSPFKKNAGFIILQYKSNLVITSMVMKGQSILVETLEHGAWELTVSGTLLTSGAVAHTVNQTVKAGGCPASLSLAVSDNDIMFYGGDNLYYYGEVALYASPRTTAKSGRVQTEMQAVPSGLKRSVVAVQFKQAEYVFFAAGGNFNDRCLKRDKILNAWSTPFIGWNVSCAKAITETDGRLRLIAGSSDPSDCRVFALEEGSDDAGTPISFMVRDKAIDGKKRGRVKRFDESVVFLSSLVGTVSIQPYIDGIAQREWFYTPYVSTATGATGGLSREVSRDALSGETGTNSLPSVQDGTVRIPHNYVKGDLLEMVYKNAVTGQAVQVLGRETSFILGDAKERLPNTKAIQAAATDTVAATVKVGNLITQGLGTNNLITQGYSSEADDSLGYYDVSYYDISYYS